MAHAAAPDFAATHPRGGVIEPLQCDSDAVLKPSMACAVDERPAGPARDGEVDRGAGAKVIPVP